MINTNVLPLIVRFLSTFCCLVSWAAPLSAQQLPPPEYQVIDRMGVNATSGQVVVEIDTLAIGGERGLSHKVASYNSNFIQQNGDGGFVGT